MKKLTFLSVLVFFILSISCLSAAAKDKVLTLEMLDSKLKKHEGTEWDAFTNDENKIKFKVTKVEKYDLFFKDVALIKGALTELNHVLEKLNEMDVNKGDGISILKEFGKPVLTAFNEKIPGLIEQAKTFTPADDFTGLKAAQAPAVAKGLVGSISTMKSALEEIPQILERINTYLISEGSEG